MTASPPVAAFDFDGTLTRRDTLLPFLASVSGRVKILGAAAPVARQFALGDRDAAKEQLLTRVLRGRDRTEIAGAGRAYGTRLAERAITAEVHERLVWHQREGHRVVIVSASLDVYLTEVAHALAVDDLLCTELEIDERGCYTGHMLGANCRGAEKARRLRAHIGEESNVLWAYGNGPGDDEMLALAEHPVRVRRGHLVSTTGV